MFTSLQSLSYVLLEGVQQPCKVDRLTERIGGGGWGSGMWSGEGRISNCTSPIRVQHATKLGHCSVIKTNRVDCSFFFTAILGVVAILPSLFLLLSPSLPAPVKFNMPSEGQGTCFCFYLFFPLYLSGLFMKNSFVNIHKSEFGHTMSVFSSLCSSTSIAIGIHQHRGKWSPSRCHLFLGKVYF